MTHAIQWDDKEPITEYLPRKSMMRIPKTNKRLSESHKNNMSTSQRQRLSREGKDVRYHDKTWLYRQYFTLNKSTTEIGELCGCHCSTVSTWLRKHGFKARTISEAKQGHIVSQETRDKIRNHPYNKRGAGHYFHPDAIKEIIRQSKMGAKNPMWKGGITDKLTQIRNSVEFKQWRWDVFVRDGFQCQMCNKASEGDLNAHHIVPLSQNVELACCLDNGISLCVECHRQVHSKESAHELPRFQKAMGQQISA
ncbi:MAG: HNH endonuclease signature motif containing protein [Candidatus Thorarchaeota archaeon]